MAVEMAIDEWGPGAIAKIAKIRSMANPEDSDHKKILEYCALIEETYLAEGF